MQHFLVVFPLIHDTVLHLGISCVFERDRVLGKFACPFDPNTESTLWWLVKSDSLLRTGEEWALPSISSLDGRPFGFTPQQPGRMRYDAIDIRDGLQDICVCRSKCMLPGSQDLPVNFKKQIIHSAHDGKPLVSKSLIVRVFSKLLWHSRSTFQFGFFWRWLQSFHPFSFWTWLRVCGGVDWFLVTGSAYNKEIFRRLTLQNCNS